MNIRYLSLFSGIEACTVAWEPLGWTPVAFAQYEPDDNVQFPSKVLQYHYPDVPNLGDVTKITEEQIKALGHIDLVVGGSPCQDMSIAGLRRGLVNEDGSLTRSGLFDYQMQIFEWARRNNGAEFMLWENVPGAFSSNEGNDFGYILGSMVQRDVPIPKDGWKNSGVCVSESGDRIVEWRVLDAQYFGVPQRRRRVFALVHTGAWGGYPPVLFESESLPRDSEKSEGKRKGSSESLGGDFGEDGFCAVDRKGIGNQYVDKGKIVMEPCRDENTFAVSQETFLNVDEGVSPPLKARDYKAPHAVCYEESVVAIEGNGMRPSHKGTGISDEGVSYTLNTTEVHGVGYKKPRIYDMKQHHAPEESDSVQLTTGNCKGVRGDTPLVMDVVSWKERDRLAQPRVNITDPVAASDYKGPSFVGYMEKDNEALCVQMANTSSNGSNINHDVSATLAKNNTLAVAYKDEK